MLLEVDKDSHHQKLKAGLIDQIRKSAMNDRLPSERKLAEKFKMCRATVNKVMVELEQEGYIVRRVGKGTFVAPRDKKIIQDSSITPRTAGSIVIAYPDFFSYIIWERVHYAEMLALKNNINLINVKLQQESTLQSVVNILKSDDDIQGVILMPSENVSRPMMKQLDSFNIPIVISGSLPPSGVYKNVYSVRKDYFKTGYMKMDHLLKNGHRKIGFVPNEPASGHGNENIKGIKQALYDHGMRWRDLLQPEKRPKYWDDPLFAGYEQTKELLSKHDLTALLFDTVRGTFGGLRALYELGLKCPDDISIITSLIHFGIDQMSTPALSTTISSTEEQMQTALDIIMNPGKMISKDYILDVKLIERESVKTIDL